ncbi:DUF1178 family protein [Hansschlegelia quercus]|uniref:DUF1178 family protein n=1 Tax=Hansschlegelia quercus TaxID=2528245 RepID=A0A4Q9GKV5_9HYPH|nr:DUF1178 family protein [Hansschlegelia quercus]TBN53981.1 DUF1178 family protein [Hansschlegelia quercus]
MIRYDLACDAGHSFDAWFRSSSDYDSQAGRGLLSCPVCGSESVAKALMAPAVATRERKEVAAPTSEVALGSDLRLREMLREIKRHVTATSEDVGERFPEVARQMHAEEVEQRAIRGRATADEAKALIEEGIAVQPLPIFPDDAN